MNRSIATALLLVACAGRAWAIDSPCGASGPGAGGPLGTCTVPTAGGDSTYDCDVANVASGYTTGNTTDTCPYKCSDGFGHTNGVICLTNADCAGSPFTFPVCLSVGDTKFVTCGSSGNDTIYMQHNGDDFVCGLGGNDTLTWLGLGTDFVNGGDGNDTITGGSGADRLFGGDGNDTISGNTGADFLEGGLGEDTINGGGGNDTIYASRSTDFVTGGGDTCRGDADNDFIVGTQGDELLFGGTGNDVLVGQGGRDVMKGEDGDDTLIAAYGVTPANDVLGSLYCGGNGNDSIVGDGPGHQCMDGGANTDSCTYSNFPDDTDTCDYATVRNCETYSKTSTNGGWDPTNEHPPCGCDN